MQTIHVYAEERIELLICYNSYICEKTSHENTGGEKVQYKITEIHLKFDFLDIWCTDQNGHGMNVLFTLP